MEKLTKKFPNLGNNIHAVLSDAGHYVEAHGHEYYADDAVAVQAIIDAYPLSSAIDEVKANIDAHAETMKRGVLGDVVTASWGAKQAEMMKYRETNQPLDAPKLQQEALSRGVTLESIVARVEANVNALGTLDAVITGVAGKHKDAVSLLTTFDEIFAYDFSTGWPKV